MMLPIPDVLDKAGVARVRAIADAGAWEDGNATSGHQSALAKRNQQLSEDSEAAKQAGRLVLDALGRSPLFIAAALPLKIFPPLFNRYQGGEAFGTHIDNAIRIHRASEFRVRSDLSATLFLEEPDAYEGGELVVEDNLGAHAVKLPAGHLLLYPVDDPRRCRARHPLRPRPLNPDHRRRPRPGRPRGDPPDRRLSQPLEALGGHVILERRHRAVDVALNLHRLAELVSASRVEQPKTFADNLGRPQRSTLGPESSSG